MNNKNFARVGFSFLAAIALTVIYSVWFTNSSYFCYPDDTLIVYDYAGIGLSLIGAAAFCVISIAKKNWEINTPVKAICTGMVAAGLAIFIIALPLIVPFFGTPFFQTTCYFL